MPFTIQPKDIILLIKGGFSNLKKHQSEIDRLNVFPVPDGDTGTNMVLTLQAILEEVDKANSADKASLINAIIFGALMGARGNSGVILSQIIKGFCDTFRQFDTINSHVLIDAFQNAVRVAYQAVRKPVEGTMLTVIRDAAIAVKNLKNQEVLIEKVFEVALKEARDSLLRTPDLLPVLKEAGVVDAGGFGLVAMVEGVLSTLKKEEIKVMSNLAIPKVLLQQKEESLEFLYCTEFVLKGEKLRRDDLEKKLENKGDSLMVVWGDESLRVHIHTNFPGDVLNLATSLGTLSQIRINNMQEQMEERKSKLVAQADSGVGIVAVANGEGIKEVLKSLGVQRIVEGGQTMNPSAQELLKEVEGCPSSEVIILPNNKNIILTAEQVKTLSPKKVYIIPTVNVPQAFSALVAFTPNRSFAENLKEMNEAISRVKVGEITRAVRDCEVNGEKVEQGKYLGIFNGEIVISGNSLIKVTSELLSKIVSDEDSLITFLFNDEVSDEEKKKIKGEAEKKFPQHEIEMYNGGQPLYQLIISVE